MWICTRWNHNNAHWIANSNSNMQWQNQDEWPCRRTLNGKRQDDDDIYMNVMEKWKWEKIESRRVVGMHWRGQDSPFTRTQAQRQSQTVTQHFINSFRFVRIFYVPARECGTHSWAFYAIIIWNVSLTFSASAAGDTPVTSWLDVYWFH